MSFRADRETQTKQASIGAVAAVLVVLALTVAGCAGESNDGGTTGTEAGASPQQAPEALGPLKATESIDDAAKRIDKALRSGDCDQINALNPISLPTLDTEERCQSLRRVTDLAVSGTEAFPGGGVVDYSLGGDRTLTAVLIVDSDGEYRIALLDPFRAKPSVGTKLDGKAFDRAAAKAVRALRDGDCDAYRAVAYRRSGKGSLPKKDLCPRVEQGPVQGILEANPAAKPERLGGNGDYAFYAFGLPGLNYTMVFARETDRGLPEQAPKLPNDAAEYSYVDAYKTNTREPPG